MIVGLVLLAWTALALGVTGAAIVGRWHDGGRPGEEACDATMAAAAVAMVVVACLGMAGALWPGVVIGIVTASGALSLLLRGAAPLRLWRRAGLAIVDALRSSAVLWVLVLLGLCCLARGLSIPQLAWDGLTYHSTYPATWVQEGRFVPLQGDGTWEVYETFPKGVEALAYLTLAFGHRDDLLNLVNLPFWVVTAVALRAALTTCGVGGTVRDLWVVIVLACPVLLAYVTPLYVEVPTAACATVALAAGARLVVRRDVRALASLGLAVGVALAIKLTALSWCLPAVVLSAFAVRSFGWSRVRGALIVAVLSGSVVALPWYVENARVCGNPLYPSAIPGFHEGSWAGTELNRWAMQETSVIGLRASDQVAESLAARPWKVRHPLGPGWLFIGLFLGSFLLPFWVDDVRRRTTALLMTLVGVFCLAVYMYTPYNGLYAEADTRFLGPCLIASALACAIALGEHAAWLRVALLGGLSALTVVTTVTAGLVWFPYSIEAGVVAALVLATFVGCVLARRSRGRPRVAWTVAATTALVASALLLPPALRARERARSFAYAVRVDLHPRAGFPRLWAHVEELPPSRIALSTGHPLAQEGWFFYPLFGADLRHHVRHVPIERQDVRACLVRGMTRDQPDELAWLRRMRRWDYLVVVSDPIELRWVERHATSFELVLIDGNARLYRVRAGR